MLNVIQNGKAGAPPLLIAHGLFGSARNWGVLSKRLSIDRHIIAVDMRNHASSPWFSSNSYHDMATDLAEIIEAQPMPADIIGHSMGGKAAMSLALTRPDLVRHLVIADIAPVRYDHTQLPLIAAMLSLELSTISSRRDADEQLRESVPDPGVRAFLLQSLNLKTQPPSWRFNLEVLAAEMDKIIGFPQFSTHFDGPTLFLSGANSDYVAPAHHAKILTLFPNAQFRQIADAQHWLHAEKPREFEAEIRALLSS
ncbi:MAG: alpha/beta fold hydrolase [Alphaproteobacteria bacterium]|nr:alpha/beta fold hydrolase [Alphaproteobacteria bacterium]